MRDYCGKNGCYKVEKDEYDSDQEILSVYLNSPVIYEGIDDGDFIRTTSENREEPEIEFVINKVSSDEGADDEYLVTSMNINVGLDGVNEFASEILNQNIDIKDNLISAIKRLLDREGAAWGIIAPEEPDD